MYDPGVLGAVPAGGAIPVFVRASTPSPSRRRGTRVSEHHFQTLRETFAVSISRVLEKGSPAQGPPSTEAERVHLKDQLGTQGTSGLSNNRAHY